MGAFGDFASDFIERNIPVIPCGGDDGKRPLVSHWQKMGITAARKHAASGRFDDANLAFITGKRTGLTVLDIDTPDPKALNTAIARFGETPIIIQTGSGKYHAWYKHNGEGRMTKPLKSEPGFEYIDILGAGICIAPPSVRPDYAGAAYRWIQGDLDDLDRLPCLENVPQANEVAAPAGMPQGERNKVLFRAILRALADGVRGDDLLVSAVAFCEGSFEEALPYPEILKTVKSAQGYHDKGENWVGRDARAVITISELDALEGNADAAFLLMKLRASHGWRAGQSFALAKAYAGALNWTLRRFMSARKFLEDKALIKCQHKGGRGPNDPPIYILS